jgi:hypothetical protein
MKIYQVRYSRYEWARCNVGFANEVDIGEGEHWKLAKTAALDDELRRFEHYWGDQGIDEYSIGVEQDKEGDPDVVILADGSVVPFEEYADKNTKTSA